MQNAVTAITRTIVGTTMPAMYARRYLCWFIKPPASQVIEQSRENPGEKEKSGASERGERPIEPGNADGLATESFEHLRPEVAAELRAFDGGDGLLEKFLHFFIDFVVVHFRPTSTPRELSFFRNIRTARKTLIFTSASELPAALAMSA